MSEALAQPHVPDEETRHRMLERFSLIDAHVDAPELGQAAVRHSENERVEVPPPAFWRRWVPDAPAATRSASEAASNDDDGDDALGLADIDIDAMLASGTIRSSTQIVQERIAPHLTRWKRPNRLASAAGRFHLRRRHDRTVRRLQLGSAARTGTQPAVPADSSLDAFWEATDGLAAPPLANRIWIWPRSRRCNTSAGTITRRRCRPNHDAPAPSGSARRHHGCGATGRAPQPQPTAAARIVASEQQQNRPSNHCAGSR